MRGMWLLLVSLCVLEDGSVVAVSSSAYTLASRLCVSLLLHSRWTTEVPSKACIDFSSLRVSDGIFWWHMKFDNSGSAHGEFWCSGCCSCVDVAVLLQATIRYPFIIDRAVHQFNPVSHQGLGSSGLVSIP
ncbi:hypothetical protein YC2023_107654 [Brassica napus]